MAGTPYIQYGKDGLSRYDSKGQRRIWLDPINLLFSFNDTNNIARCQIGNLPANGVSPAHWSFRVNDANGNPIYDTIGVIASSVMQSLGIGSQSGTQNFASTTYADITGSVVNITVTRQATFGSTGSGHERRGLARP